MDRSELVREILQRSGDDLGAIAKELEDDAPTVVRKVAPGRAEYRTRAIVGAPPEELPAIEAASRARLEEFVEPSRTAVDKLIRHGEDADLGTTEVEAAEAIVLLMARPAILVQGGSFFPAPEPWSGALESSRQEIEAVLGSVGRIELTGHPELDWVGTGWLASPRVVLTNRHVAETFARAGSSSWTFTPRIRSRIDFAEEINSDAPREFDVTGIVGVYDRHDLAALRVTQRSGTTLPPTLPLAAEPKLRKGSKVYAVGYPAADSRRNDPAEMARIFGGIYNLKRLQPGALRSVSRSASRVVHDCSTLGGNSGSCLVDLTTHLVVGLHFGGRYLQGNEAVAMWTLRSDPLIKKAKIEFV
jgi:S1-C subfamily serine protease